jgi:hypothetical protein
MTENKLAELAEILAQRGRKDPVLKFKSTPSELRSQG